MGDMHFSQGDGEVSFCGAIEMHGFLHLKCDIIRGGVKQYLEPMGPTPLHVMPIFEIGPLEPRYRSAHFRPRLSPLRRPHSALRQYASVLAAAPAAPAATAWGSRNVRSGGGGSVSMVC